MVVHQEPVLVVGGGMSEKEREGEHRRPVGTGIERCPTGVRGLVVVKKPGNTGGAKAGQESEEER